jgi:hypothetical protein
MFRSWADGSFESHVLGEIPKGFPQLKNKTSDFEAFNLAKRLEVGRYRKTLIIQSPLF